MNGLRIDNMITYCVVNRKWSRFYSVKSADKSDILSMCEECFLFCSNELRSEKIEMLILCVRFKITDLHPLPNNLFSISRASLRFCNASWFIFGRTLL